MPETEIRALRQDLALRHVALSVVRGRLRVAAPPGVLSSRDRDLIALARSDLIDLIAAEVSNVPTSLPTSEVEDDLLDAAGATDGPDAAIDAALIALDLGPLLPATNVAPEGCIGQLACRRLGPCDRHLEGEHCLVGLNVGPEGGR